MLRVIGAGLPRTATHSLKLALIRLGLDPCYHMSTLFEHLDDIAIWQQALDGEAVDWPGLLAPYRAAIDWPASAFWRELADEFPAALIVLSLREDGETWWRSVDATIMDGYRDAGMPADWRQMAVGLWRRAIGPGWDDPAANAAAYESWVDSVRHAAPRDRLLEWRASDGWAPLCAALGVDEPGEPFPNTNSSVEWEQRRRERVAEEASTAAVAEGESSETAEA